MVSAFIILPLCSATLYSVSTDYKVTYQRSHDELAHCTYDMKANEQGWSYLAIFANGEKDLFEQHRGAGFLEGYVTYRDIYAASNNLANALFNSKTLGAAIHNYIDQQM